MRLSGVHAGMKLCTRGVACGIRGYHKHPVGVTFKHRQAVHIGDTSLGESRWLLLMVKRKYPLGALPPNVPRTYALEGQMWRVPLAPLVTLQRSAGIWPPCCFAGALHGAASAWLGVLGASARAPGHAGDAGRMGAGVQAAVAGGSAAQQRLLVLLGPGARLGDPGIHRGPQRCAVPDEQLCETCNRSASLERDWDTHAFTGAPSGARCQMNSCVNTQTA